jgi:hypothetical protein
VRTWIKVDAQDASLYEGQTAAKEHALLLVLNKPRPDGRRLAVLATAQEDRWRELEPTLRKSLTSLRFGPPAPPVVVVPDPKVPAGPEVSLPDDPRAPVVIFDYVGGFTLPRRTKDPQLVIRADGSVTLIDPFGRLPKIETKITRENLVKFMQFALVERHFFALDEQAIDKQIRAEQQRGGVVITDLPKTVIHLRTGKSEWRVSVAGPRMYAEAFPHLKALQDLAAIEARLEQYVDKLREPRSK